MILNGSPRAPKSNSKKYADAFMKYPKNGVDYFGLIKYYNEDLCDRVGKYSDILMVFPLYADGIPVTMLDFLKVLERKPPEKKPVASDLINCGFIESRQNDTAVRMIELFCIQNNYKSGSVLKIGSGEAIMGYPV